MENNCESCTHYSQNYAIRGSKLIRADGRCLKKRGAVIKQVSEPCKHYTESKKPDIETQIKDALIKMAERLDEIALILNREDE